MHNKIYSFMASALCLFTASLMPHAAASAKEPSVFSIKAPPPKMEIFLREPLKVLKQDGEELFFDAELAITRAQQAQGMMHRTEMDNDDAMLFIFNDESKRAFWMKNTLIPLDMLFIARDGKIHHIHHNAKPQDLSRITSERDSLAVLEIKGGMSGKLGIKSGDSVIYKAFKNTTANATQP